MSPLLCIALTLLTPGLSAAATLVVDISGGGAYVSIQDAVDAASAGDTVLVRPGRYIETVSIVGVDIHLIGESGATSTIIDGAGTGPVIHCLNISENSSIQGFTITGGVAPLAGGGIYLVSLASPLVKDNIVVGNRAEVLGSAFGAGSSYGGATGAPVGRNPPPGLVPTYCEPIPGSGGGIYVHFQCLPTIVDNVIKENEAVRDGGGVVFWDHADCTFERNVVVHNVAGRNGGGIFIGCNAMPTLERNVLGWNEALSGGGLHLQGFEADAEVRRNTFLKNSASGGAGGIHCEGTCAPVIVGNLLVESQGPGMLCDEVSAPYVSCNNIWDSDGGDFDGKCFEPGVVYSDLDNDIKSVSLCAPWAGDFRPCAHPLQSTCGPIGVEDDFCGSGACGVSKTSWGLIKALYRYQ